MSGASREAGPRAVARRGQRGFALLVALLALLALSILAAAGAFATRSEGRIALSHAATVRARELARSGLSEYLATGAGVAGRRTFVHGRDTAVVAATRLLHVADDSSRVLYLLTSRGVRVHRPGDAPAERTLSAVLLRDDSLPGGRAEWAGTRHEPGPR